MMITVEHEWRKDRRTGKPLVTKLSILTFQKCPSAQHPETNEMYPNGGWKRIKEEALIEPKAAKEAKSAKKDSSIEKLQRLADNVQPEEVK